MKKRLYTLFLALAGLAFILSAFFARQLGIDNNDGWGRGRSLLLLFGLFFWLWLVWLLTATQRRRLLNGFYQSAPLVSLRQSRDRFQRLWQNSSFHHFCLELQRRFIGLPGIRWLAASPQRQTRFWAGLGLLITLLVYTWLGTAGTFTRLVPSSNFFDLQARAFLQGQVHLLENPSAELLALENPYSVDARQGINYIWDASLYHNRYYLYWGPIPALLAAAYRAVSGSPLGDESLAFGFLCLLAAVQTLWILELHRRYFKRVPPVWLLLFVLLIGLANPIPYDIARLMVYEASILSGQVFLLGGLLCLLKGLPKDGRFPIPYWLLAGLLFGFSLSARINLLPVVFFIGLMLLIFIINHYKSRWRDLIPPLLSAALTFAVVMIAIMAYNAVRFDSPFEFGSRYQLTVTDINHAYNTVVSTAYIIPNAYAYLLRPPVMIGRFPFMYADWLTDQGWPFFIRVPAGYFYTDPVLGLLLVAPFIWLLLPILFHLLAELRKNGFKSLLNTLGGPLWLLYTLAGVGFISFVFILLFYYPAMRYLTDATPVLFLLSICGAMLWLEHPRLNGFKGLLIFLLAIGSILAGILLGINGPHDFFEQANPALYYALINFFKW